MIFKIQKEVHDLFPDSLTKGKNTNYKQHLIGTFILIVSNCYNDKSIVDKFIEILKNDESFSNLQILSTSEYKKIVKYCDKVINTFWDYLHPSYKKKSDIILPFVKVIMFNPQENLYNKGTVHEVFVTVLGNILMNHQYDKFDKFKAESLFNICNFYLISEALKNPKIMNLMKINSTPNIKKKKTKPKKKSKNTNLKKDLDWFTNKGSFKKLERTKLVSYEEGHKPRQQFKSTRKFPNTGYWVFVEKHRSNNKWKAYLRIYKKKYWQDFESSGYCKEAQSAWDSLYKKLTKND